MLIFAIFIFAIFKNDRDKPTLDPSDREPLFREVVALLDIMILIKESDDFFETKPTPFIRSQPSALLFIEFEPHMRIV